MAAQTQPSLPAEVEKDLKDFQSMQRQLQNTLLQKQQLQVQLEEAKLASDGVESATGALFKAAGGLLIQTTKEAAQKELADKKETFELRLSMMAKQEKQLTDNLNALKTKLEAALKQAPSA